MTDPRISRRPPTPPPTEPVVEPGPLAPTLPPPTAREAEGGISPVARDVLAALEASLEPSAPTEGAVSGPRERLREGLERLGSRELSSTETHDLRTELNRLAEEIHEHPRGDPAQLSEDLLLLHQFYSASDTESANTIAAELRTLRDQVFRPHARLAPGATATITQLGEARLAARISRELGHEAALTMDLRQWTEILHRLPDAAMGNRERAEQLTGILQNWIVVRDRFRGGEGTSLLDVPIPMSEEEVLTTMRGLREEMLQELRNSGVPEAQIFPISTLVTQAIEYNDPEAAANLTVDSLLARALPVVELSHHLDETRRLENPEERRAQLFLALREAIGVRNEHYTQEILRALQETLPVPPTAEDRFLLMISEATLLRGSGLYQSTQLLQDARAWARELLSDTTGFPAARGNALLAAHTFFQLMPDEALSPRIDAELRSVADLALNDLQFDESLTDPRDRIALAAFAVQADQISFEEELRTAGGAAAARAIGDRLLARIDLLQQELSRAGDLPVEFRLEQGRNLAGALASYERLTEGDSPAIPPGEFQARVTALENFMLPVFENLCAPSTDAPDAGRELARQVVYDLRTRLHFALMNGEAAWAAHLSAEGITEFVQLSERAHVLLSGWGNPPTPQQIEEHLGSAAIFAQLGLDNQVRDTLNPVRGYANQIGDIFQRFSFFQNLIQFYQAAGMTTEGNALLQDMAELAGRPEATDEMRRFGEIIPALEELNAGHLDQAAELLEILSDNPIALETLERLRDGVRTERLTQITAVWSAVIQDYLAEHRESGGAHTDRIERSLQRALLEAVARVRSGDCASIYEGLRQSDNPDVSLFLYEGRHAFYAQSLSNPNLSREEFATGVLELAQTFSGDQRYALAGNLAQMVSEDPDLGARARAFIENLEWQPYWDEAPRAATMLLLSFVAGPEVFAAYMTGSFLLETDERSAYLGLAENAVALATFGAGELASAYAARCFVNTSIAGAMSPLARGAATWAVRSTASAAAFVPMGMASAALFSGSTEGLTFENFATQFGAMMVVFAVCHGVGMGAGALGRAAERVSWLRAAEGAVAAGGPRLNWAGRGMVGVAGYTGTIAGLAGTEYLNEALGLHDSESDSFYASLGLPAPTEEAPFFLRVLRSAIMDSHMRFMGATANSVSAGMIEHLNRETAGRVFQLDAERRFLPTVERMGFEPRSEAGQLVLATLVGRAMGGERLEDIEASMAEHGEIRRDVDRALRMILEVDPASPRGHRLSALLIAYHQSYPETSLAETVGNMELTMRSFARRTGLRGATAEHAVEALLENMLSSSLTAEQVRQSFGEASEALITATRAAEATLTEGTRAPIEGEASAPGAAARAQQAVLRFLREIFSENPTAAGIMAAAATLLSSAIGASIAAGGTEGTGLFLFLGLSGMAAGAIARNNPEPNWSGLRQNFLEFVRSLPDAAQREFQNLLREMNASPEAEEAVRADEESGIAPEPDAIPARHDRDAPAVSAPEAAPAEEGSGVRARTAEPVEVEVGEVTRPEGSDEATRVTRRPQGELGDEDTTGVSARREEVTRFRVGWGEERAADERARREETMVGIPEELPPTADGTPPSAESLRRQLDLLDQIAMQARLADAEMAQPFLETFQALISQGSLVLDGSSLGWVEGIFRMDSVLASIDGIHPRDRIGIRQALVYEILQGRGREIVQFFSNARERYDRADDAGRAAIGEEVRANLRERFRRFAELPEMASALVAAPELARREAFLPEIRSDSPVYETLENYEFQFGTDSSPPTWGERRRTLENFAGSRLPPGPLVNLARRAREALQTIYDRAREIQNFSESDPDSPRIAEAETEIGAARQIIRDWEAAGATRAVAVGTVRGLSDPSGSLHTAFRRARATLTASPREESGEINPMGEVRSNIFSVNSFTPDSSELADAWLDPAQGDQGRNPLDVATITLAVGSGAAIGPVAEAVQATLRRSGFREAHLTTAADRSIRMELAVPDEGIGRVVVRIITNETARSERAVAEERASRARSFEGEAMPLPSLRRSDAGTEAPEPAVAATGNDAPPSEPPPPLPPPTPEARDRPTAPPPGRRRGAAPITGLEATAPGVAAAPPITAPPLPPPAEGAPRAVRRVFELAGSDSPLAAHARRVYEELHGLSPESSRHAKLMAEATTLSEIANAAGLNPGEADSPLYSYAVRYRDLAQSTRETLSGLEAGSQEYRDALRDYRNVRDNIGWEIEGEFEGPMGEVLTFLRGLSGDRVSWEPARRAFPFLKRPEVAADIPAEGRLKDPADILAKLDRRGISSLESMTDFAGTRVVVEGYEDVMGVVAMIQDRFEIRELRDAEGNVLTEGGETRLDRDRIRRLIEGGRSGYRAIHVVVEVNGRPVEIQIQTRATHEWYRIDHAVRYEAHDLPAAYREPLDAFFLEAAQFLADVEQGAAYGEPPDHEALLDTLPLDLSPERRMEIESGILELAAVMRNAARGDEGSAEPEAPVAPVIALRRPTPPPAETELPLAADEPRPPPPDRTVSLEAATPETAPPSEVAAPEAAPAEASATGTGETPPTDPARSLMLGMGLFGGGSDPITPFLMDVANSISPEVGHWIAEHLPQGLLPAIIGAVGLVVLGGVMGRGGSPPPPRRAEFVPGSGGSRDALQILPGTESVVIGRAHGFFESDDAVSREHATIARGTDGRWYIRDGVIAADGSRRYSGNGVSLVDARTGASYRLPHHLPMAEGEWIVLDPAYEIRMGNQTFAFRGPSEASSESRSFNMTGTIGDYSLHPNTDATSIEFGRADYPGPSALAPRVSARHCGFERRGDRWFLRDLGAKNGVFLNGERVTGETEIRPGDVVSTRETSFTLFPLFRFDPARADASATSAVPLEPYTIHRYDPRYRGGRGDVRVGHLREARIVSTGEESAVEAVFDVPSSNPGEPAQRVRVRIPWALAEGVWLVSREENFHLGREFLLSSGPDLPNPYEGTGLPSRRLADGRYELDLEELALPPPAESDESWRTPDPENLGGIAAGSHEGIGYKDHNEDRYVVVALPEGGTVTVAIDGMGGHGGGERAAAIAQQVIERALRSGIRLNQAIEWADRAIAQDTVARRIRDNHTPGAVVSGFEIRPNADGTYEASFDTVGDAATAAFDLSASGDARLLTRTESHARGRTLEIRISPFANLVDQALGGHYRHGERSLEHSTARATLESGNMVLSGSDGFWENFRDYAEIADIMQASGERTAEGIRRVLMNEAFVRMRLLEIRSESPDEHWTITRERYEDVYREMTGEAAPSTPWRYEGLELDSRGNVLDPRDTRLGGIVGHFKADNVTLLVQVVGETVTPPREPAVPAAVPAVVRAPIVRVGEGPLSPPPPGSPPSEIAVPYSAEPLRGLDLSRMSVGTWVNFRFLPNGRAERVTTGSAGSHAIMVDAQGRIHLRAGSRGGGEISAVDTTLVVEDEAGTPRHVLEPLTPGQEVLLDGGTYATEIAVSFGRGRETVIRHLDLSVPPGRGAEAELPALAAAEAVSSATAESGRPMVLSLGPPEGLVFDLFTHPAAGRSGTVYEFRLTDETASDSIPRIIRLTLPPGEVLNPDTFRPTLPSRGTAVGEWNGRPLEFEWN